jgi:hypothetical protein
MTAATREQGREHARWLRQHQGQDALDDYAARILANTNRPGPFSLGLLDVAKGILSGDDNQPTTEGN